MTAALNTRRLRLGRLALYVEPRDAWVGVYVAPDAVYVCPLPFCVAKWERSVDGPNRIIPPPSGPGRWQLWARRRTGSVWTEWRLLGRYRTRWAARLVCWGSRRNAAGWGEVAEFEVRPATAVHSV